MKPTCVLFITPSHPLQVAGQAASRGRTPRRVTMLALMPTSNRSVSYATKLRNKALDFSRHLSSGLGAKGHTKSHY